MKKVHIILIFVFVLLVGVCFAVLDYFNLLPQRVYYAEELGIETIKSTIDYNGNGKDDYSDIVLGARADAKNHPKYNGAYYDGGYPSDDIGVCTDVVWRAFKAAGYSLKDMVDKDVERRLSDYTNIVKPDSNIDFRRVKNLRVFFKKYGQDLTLDTAKVNEWQPGDIVIFGDDKHIGIVSDKRNSKGVPFIIHNGGQPNREEDVLGRSEVTGHYRFDASLIDEEVLIRFE